MTTTKPTVPTIMTLNWDLLATFLESRLSHPVRVLQIEDYVGTGHYHDCLVELDQPDPLCATYLVGGDVRAAVIYPLNRPKTNTISDKVIVEPKLSELLSEADLIYHRDNELIHADDVPQLQIVQA